MLNTKEKLLMIQSIPTLLKMLPPHIFFRAEQAADDSAEMRAMREEWEELWRLERQMKEEEAHLKAEAEKQQWAQKYGVILYIFILHYRPELLIHDACVNFIERSCNGIERSFEVRKV
jgi:hypothetical protein